MLSLIIDIQSDKVRGTLVNFDKSKNKSGLLEVAYSTTVDIAFKYHVTADYVNKMMIKAVDDVALKIFKEGVSYVKEPIHSIHFILSSPWVISQSKTVKIEYENDTEITDALIQKIITEEKNILIKKYREQDKDDENYEFDIVFIEEKIFDIELNGYSVNSYKNKKAKNLSLSFSFTLSSDKIIKKIQNSLDRIVHINREYYHSCLLLYYLAFRSHIMDEKEYILMHVHGEITDLVIIKRGYASYMASFPFGVTTFLRKASLSLKASLETTSSNLSMYENGQLDEVQSLKIENSISNVVSSWRNELKNILATTKKDFILPNVIHLTSPHFKIFKKILENEGYRVDETDEAFADKEMTFNKESDRDRMLEMYIVALKNMI